MSSAEPSAVGPIYDVLVVGLGAMGSAALYHLAARGCRAIGIDAYNPPHSLGSTHGRSRIIREALYEHPSYVPLVRRAYEHWDALERATGKRLFQRTGGLMIGAPDSGLIRGTAESAARHGIPVEPVASGEISRRFGAIAAAPQMVGMYERNAGVLFPEACVQGHLDMARSHGAEQWTDTRILSVENDGSTVTAMTTRGPVRARRLVLSAGPWAPALLEGLGAPLPLMVERQTMHWFKPSERPQRGEWPVMLIEHEPDRYFYAMPDLGDGVKAAIHYEGATVSPDRVDRSVGDADTSPVRALVDAYLPGATTEVLESAVCLYTNTPDHHFIIDRLDGAPNVTLVSACSGHGFKFSSVIGEISAQLALDEEPSLDISFFRANRFNRAG